jgi:hypothetical protein
MESLKITNFSIGERVSHVDEGAGTVLKNISNEYSHVYLVKYDNGFTLHSSESLLTY